MYKIRYGEQTLLLKILQIFAQKIFLFLKCNYFYYIEESGNGHFENIVPTSFFITLVVVVPLVGLMLIYI